MDQAIDTLIDVLEDMISSGEDIPDDILDEITALLVDYARDLSQPANQEPEVQRQLPETPIEIPENIQLLWRLSNGHIPAFVNYLGSYPDPRVNEIAANPSLMATMIQHLQSMNIITPEAPESGLPPPTYFSSNVTGVKYDPSSKKMLVSFFREGKPDSVYNYDGVPPQVYQAVRDGRGFATTYGGNSRAKFWPGKSPSVGGALNQSVKKPGYSYQRLR